MSRYLLLHLTSLLFFSPVVLSDGGNCSDIVSPTATASSIILPTAQITIPLHTENATPLPTFGGSQSATLRMECTVEPRGWGRDDSDNILEAAMRCGHGGTITLPAPYVYTIARPLYMYLEHARLNVYGVLSFTADLGYWIQNSHRIEFQNQSTSWIISGNDYVVDGGGWQEGGILGNGQAWYTRAQGFSNQFGRPIPLAIYNSTDVTITNFSIYDPQFWSIYIQDSSHIRMSGIYINGTNTDPAGNGSNYAVNVDGFDTLRVDDLVMQDYVFQGGDDCFSLKGNSTNISLTNLTCVGGGIAFGSVGQYPGFPDYIANVSATNISVTSYVDPLYGGADVTAGAYFKSWVGVEMGVPPQGGGGGTGFAKNITFRDLVVDNTTRAVYINKCYYKVPAQANYCDTSTYKFEDLSFHDVSGTTASSVGVDLNCSLAAPCTDISFSNVDLMKGKTGTSIANKCINTGNVKGITCT